LFDLVESFKKNTAFPSRQHDDFLLGKMLHSMRELKTAEEVVMMRKAINISNDAHLEMMRALSPGMTEYQTQAVGEFIFRMQGAAGPAYPSICGAAENSCILHYHDNGRLLKSGDLILLDMGAEYQGYAADITRTLPVSGQFTGIQKKIYDLVLSAQRAAISMCKPGNSFKDPDIAARKVLRQGLMDLGILDESGDLSTFYPHGTSHYLGLDVHDTGTPAVLKPGMILTVEPGLYFPENSNCDPDYWNIGIRIEDDILITGDGHLNLSGNLPVETADIEQVMQSPSVFMPFQPKK
jgi:Xaa-Pro aminopeptidase